MLDDKHCWDASESICELKQSEQLDTSNPEALDSRHAFKRQNISTLQSQTFVWQNSKLSNVQAFKLSNSQSLRLSKFRTPCLSSLQTFNQ